MDVKNAVAGILRDATGKRTSGRELLVAPTRSYLDADVAAILKEQWRSAGRDRARVMMRLSEANGANPHYVTGWDGKSTFVCMTETGLTYVDQRKLERLKHDSDWNSEIRLVEIRAPILNENMERADVKMLIDRIKRTLTKSGKKRRKGRLRNMEKFFAAAVVESKGILGGPECETAFEKVDEKDDRIPEAPKKPSTKKLPKGRTDESFTWDHLDSSGRPRRRRLTHPMMRSESNQTSPQLDKREHVRMDGEGKGGGGGATPGGNKTDAQLSDREQIDVRHESNQTTPQVDKRELVRMDGEGGGGETGATPGGNKSDPQDNLRELVRMDRETVGGAVHSEGRFARANLIRKNLVAMSRIQNEETASGAKDSSDDSDDPDFTTYAGEKSKKDSEFSSRPKITVRHEALGGKKASKLFGPDSAKKAPGNKKPLLMLVLMGKGKKASMSEASMSTCLNCGTSHAEGPGPIGMMRGIFSKPEKTKPGEEPKDNCPTCKGYRSHGGPKSGMTGGVNFPKMEIKPKRGGSSTFESRRYGRSRLNMAEGKKGTPPAFLANIEKMKAKAKARKDSQDLEQDCA